MPEEVKAVVTVIGTLLLMVLIMVGAYYASRFVGGSLNNSGRGVSGSRIEILDKSFMGKDKSLLIVRVAGKVLLLGVTPQQIQKVDELDPALFPEGQAVSPAVDFKTILKDAWKQRGGKQDKGDGTQL